MKWAELSRYEKVIERENNRIKAVENERDVLFCSSTVKIKDRLIKGRPNLWYMVILNQIECGWAKLIYAQSDKDKGVYEVNVDGKRVKVVYDTKSKKIVTGWFI